MSSRARSVQRRRTALLCAIAAVLLWLPPQAGAQRGRGNLDSAQAQVDLQKAIELTRHGQFQQAIPLFVALQGSGSSYLVNFNLALCYVATRQYRQAIEALQDVRATGRDTPELENLLAQAYIGAGDTGKAWSAVQSFSRMAAKNEKLYVFAADACMEAGEHELGLKVVELGLKQLPKSARLLFERGLFLSELDQFDVARADFERTVQLAPGTDIAYIAAAQKALYEGNNAEAARMAREGLEKGQMHFLLLAIFGEAVMRAGTAPDQPDFADATAALERVVAEHANYASAQIALGKLYLAGNRLDDAIGRLEAARALDDRNPAVYSNLATAYRRRGDAAKAQEMLAVLARLNQEQVEKIRTAPGERKAGYASRATRTPPPQP